MSRYFKILLYVSLAFLAYYLYRFDYVQFTNLSFSWICMVLSITFLLLGFLWDAVCWRKALKAHNISISLRAAVVSHGVAIFAKYIPGKAWTILGRATYIASERIRLKDATFVSAKAQIVAIFVGLIIGLVPYSLVHGFSFISYIALILITVIFLFLSSKRIQRTALRMLSKIIKKDFTHFTLNLRKSYEICAYYLFYWFLLMIGYYLLAASVLDNRSIAISFALPISTTLGILALIAPGGLGVREGVMVGFLSLLSVPLKEAITFSILARFWCVMGELFIFTLAVLLRIKDRSVIIKQDRLKYDQS